MNFSNEIEDRSQELGKTTDQMTHRSGSDSATFFRVDGRAPKHFASPATGSTIYTRFINVYMYLSLSQGL